MNNNVTVPQLLAITDASHDYMHALYKLKLYRKRTFSRFCAQGILSMRNVNFLRSYRLVFFVFIARCSLD